MIGVLALAMAAVGCGSNNGSNSSNVNGNWSATLSNSASGPTVYAFNTTLTEANGGGLTVTNFTFTSTGSCFVSGQTSETGNFTLSGNFNGNVTGTFGMTINSLPSSGMQNVLTLQGGVGPNNTVAGTWNLTRSSGC